MEPKQESLPSSNSRLTLERINFRLSVKQLALWTVFLPLVSLLICFVTSMIFDFKLVNTTVCKVYNFCPSVSAITGISPQRYIWRIGVALHSAPRILLATLYNTYHVSRVKFIVDNQKAEKYLVVVRANYWLYIAEIMALVGVTYISNKENYPLHEKIFIVFMASSIAYMLTTCIVVNMAKHSAMTNLERTSMRAKICLFGIITLFSSGLMFFFYKHRVHCEELAFSWFSLCEYVICAANMAFHATIVWDIGDDDIFVGQYAVRNGDVKREKKDE